MNLLLFVIWAFGHWKSLVEKITEFLNDIYYGYSIFEVKILPTSVAISILFIKNYKNLEENTNERI